MTDNLEELKASTQYNLAMMKNRMDDAFEQLNRISSQNKIVYLNGKSEEVKKEALAARKKIKTREVNVPQ